MTVTAEVVIPRPDVSEVALSRVTAALAAHAARHDRTGEVPWDGLRIVHEAGLLTATVGAAHGGPALGLVDTARVLVALGEGDPSVALIVANSLHTHAAQAAAPHWPEELYADLLRRSLDGPAPVNAIRAEPELGAPARGGLPATTLTATAEGWTLSGRKSYATGGTALAYHVVWAVTDEPKPRVGHVLVPGDADGITWIETWDHLGLRASNTHDVVYDRTPVRSDAFVEIPRGEDGVYRDPAATPGIQSFWHPALYVGAARAARSAFVAYANDRVPTALGAPIATTERIQAVAGEIETQVAQAEALLFGTLARAEAGELEAVAPQLGVLKGAIARAVVAAASAAVEALGNPGLSRRNSLERHLRDVLCVRVHPPQLDAAQIAAGRRVLGIS